MANGDFPERVQGNMKTIIERWIEVVKSLTNEPNEGLRADGGCCHNKVSEAFQWHSTTPHWQTSKENRERPCRTKGTAGSVLHNRNLWATATHGASDGFQARRISPEKAVITPPILPKSSPPVKSRLPSSTAQLLRSFSAHLPYHEEDLTSRKS